MHTGRAPCKGWHYAAISQGTNYRKLGETLRTDPSLASPEGEWLDLTLKSPP